MIGFLNKRFSILGEGEKSCQVVSCAGFINRNTQLMCLVEIALQGIGFMNIIPQQFFMEFPTAGWGSPHIYRNGYHSTLGGPFKKTGTSLADPLLPLLDILVARFPILSETVYASTRLWVR